MAMNDTLNLRQLLTPANLRPLAAPILIMKRGAVIGLLRGERKHVFPLAQFVDGRPIEGMSDVVRVIGNPRAAWQWLIQPKPSIGGAPLERLKKGHVSQVVDAAERDFG